MKMTDAEVMSQKFGHLTPIRGELKPGSRVASHWLCLCDCGNTTLVARSSLTNGRTRSCGCSFRLDALSKARTRHGHSKRGKMTTEYRIWSSILTRCLNPKCRVYPHYGGRGIRVCDRWRSFENFLSDMGPRPSSKHSIERVDNSGDYAPKNCCWATKSEQNLNSRRNHYLEFDGKRLTVLEWAAEVGIKYATLWFRINAGWSAERALTTPVAKR